ncbi:hypothetical protein [Streptomyces sp. SID13588]|uniref:hypothetical protein n=1 Tax=Streptomyces sp. SID13588 TaxID=2706051 RepID=UPI0013C8FBD2|nr:hypothetical protein [Streptomyces sp. SID13588]NEA76194.1 hypothetical protein [Streptomyces sp. SID13588]
MTTDVVLHLDRASAEDLHEVPWLVGEHHAAGAHIPALPHETNERLAAQIIQSLADALGKKHRFS